MNRFKSFLVLLAFIGLSLTTQAQTIRYVKPVASGSGNGSSWANASGNLPSMVNASLSGDQVWIAGGTYLFATSIKEGVNVFGGFLGIETATSQRYRSDLDNNGIIEPWEFTYATILDGQNTKRVLNQTSNFTIETVWDGVTITKGSVITTSDANAYGGGAYIRVKGRLVNCIVKGNTATSSFSGMSSNGGGIYNNGGIITNCMVSGNTASAFVPSGALSYGGGVYNNGGTITNCVISENTTIASGNPSYAHAYGGGIYNNFATLSGGTITINNCVISGNTANGSESSNGGGIYNASLRNTITMTNCVVSGNAATATSSSRGGGIYNSYGMSGGSGGGTIIITDCTVYGNTSEASSSSSNASGGGICNSTLNNVTVTITNCTVNGNMATSSSTSIPNFPSSYSSASYGGGIDNSNSSGTTITNCTVSGNASMASAPGIYSYSGGGGIYNSQEATNISNCIVENNNTGTTGTRQGGGIYQGSWAYQGDLQGNVSHCIIRGNSADEGGGLYWMSDNMVSNCLIVNNNAIYGGGSYVGIYYGDFTYIYSPSFINCNFINNTGGGLSGNGNSSVTAYNCIFWKNNGTQISGGTMLAYSAVQGGYAGMGNINLATQNDVVGGPKFIDPINGDYQLQAGSPCINAGSNSLLSAEDALDLSGEPRISGGIVDMGAYEWQGCGALPTITNPTSAAICGSGQVTLNATANAGAIVRWYSESVGGEVLGIGTSYTTEPINLTTTYYAEAYNSTTGCVSSSRTAVTATVNPLPVVSITGTTAICVNATTNLSPTAGGTWTSNSPSVASVTNGGIVAGLTAGTATFTFTNSATGCQATTTSVTVNPLPIVSITGATAICVNATTNLSPTTGGTWTSNSPNVASVTNGGVVTGLTAGTATFTFTNSATGCQATTTAVTVNTLPVVSITGSTAICVNATTNLTPTTGGTWTSNSSSVASVTNSGVVTGLTAGTATFTFTNSTTGCQATTLAVTVNSLPIVSITGATTICVNATTNLTPTTGGTWTSNSSSVASVTNSGVVTGLTAGTATFTFTNSTTGCQATTLAVTVNSLPIVSITGATAICVNATTNLSPTTGGTWTSNSPSVASVANGGVVTGLTAGTATFTFTNSATGCQATTSAVTVNALPIVSITGSNSICMGTTTQLSPTSGGTWLSSNNAVATVTDAGVVTGVSGGTATFTFTNTTTSCQNTTQPVTVTSCCVTTVSQFNAQISAYATATENVVIEVCQNLTLNSLVEIPTPATAGITLTIRSENPTTPITLVRDISGSLFTVSNNATFILEDIIIDGARYNGFTEGGGSLVVCAGGATLIMNEGAIVQNNATSVSFACVEVYLGTFIMNGGKIINNTNDIDYASAGGGVSLYYSIFIMNGGEISGNTFTSTILGAIGIGGGGVSVRYSSFTMNGGKITGNTTNMQGGGVLVYNGTFNLNEGEISENIGIGVHLVESGTNTTFTMNGGKINKNTDCGVIINGVGNTNTTFIMSGGKISENTGTGVYVWGIHYNPSFIMTGGEIRGNIINDDWYGGVMILGTFELGGTAVVTDNILMGTSYQKNVSLHPSYPYITLSTSTPPASGMNVGVTQRYNDGVFVQSGATAQHLQYFTADEEGREVILYGASGLQIVLKTYSITWHTDGGIPVPTQTTVIHGDYIYAPAEMTKTGYIFGGWYFDQEFTTEVTFPITNVTTATTLYAKWNGVGISENETANIRIYPNPTTGELTITNYELKITNIEVFDIYGRKLSSNHLISTSPHHQINISHLSPSIYFLKISTEAGEVIRKVVKE